MPAFRRFVPLIAAAVALGLHMAPCLAADAAPTAVPEPASGRGAEPARQELTPQILYQYLIAEIAASRGELGLASEAYAELAKTTKDVRIARRAAEVSFYARRYDDSLAAARIWVEREPESMEARQTLWTLLAATRHGEELLSRIEGRLKAAGKGTGDAIIELGRMLARWPDKKAAEGLLIHVTNPYESLPETFYARAQAAHATGAEDRALSNIDQAIALKPGWEAAVLFKAQLISADPEKTTDLLSGYLTRQPAARAIRLAYARALVDAKRYSEARQQFERLIGEDKDNPELRYSAGLLALETGDLPGGERYLKPLLDSNFANKDSVRYYLGHAAERGGRSDEAIGWFDSVGARSGNFVSARARAASLLRKQGRLDEARRRLQQAAAEAPRERTDLVIAESRLLIEAKQPEEAYRVMDAALAAQPEDATLLYESAMVAERTGKFDVLERNLQKLIKLQPDNPQAYNALGYSLADRNLRLDEALKLIEKALALAPQDPFILDSRGWVAFRRGDPAGALDYLRKAFILSGDPEVAAHLGEVLWTQGRRDEALTTWNDALKANPDNDVLPATIKRFKP